MRHQDQVAEAGKLLSYLDTRTTAMADSVYRNPVSDYTCPRQAGIEREFLFRRGPINIGLGWLLPNPDGSMTHDYTDILRIPVRLEVIFPPWGLRGNEIRSQPAR